VHGALKTWLKATSAAIGVDAKKQSRDNRDEIEETCFSALHLSWNFDDKDSSLRGDEYYGYY
jgi:hypothetical protein